MAEAALIVTAVLIILVVWAAEPDKIIGDLVFFGFVGMLILLVSLFV